MLRVNGLEKLSMEEVQNIDVDGLQVIIEFCRVLPEIKELGDTVNISNILENNGLEFDLDNGKILKRVKITGNFSYLLVYIYENKHVFRYTFSREEKKLVSKDLLPFVIEENIEGEREYGKERQWRKENKLWRKY